MYAILIFNFVFMTYLINCIYLLLLKILNNLFLNFNKINSVFYEIEQWIVMHTTNFLSHISLSENIYFILINNFLLFEI